MKTALALVTLLAIPACALFRAPGGGGAGGSISGRVRGDHVPADASIEVYRDEGGAPTPVAGVTARPDRLGQYETPTLPPGRYLVVLRTREAPPATASAVVPGRPVTDLRLATPGPAATITLVNPATAGDRIVCVMTPADSADRIPDRREAVLGAGAEVRLAGLAPGIWHVDVSPNETTADFVVPGGEAVTRLLIDPGAFPGTMTAGGSLSGRILHADGTPARGVVVTVRGCSTDGLTISAWGRLARPDGNGLYSLEHLPPGMVYVRVEGREVRHPVLPQPVLAQISPSRPASQDFTIRP